MAAAPARVSSFSVALPDERATQRLAIDIANALERGDFVTLSGDLGAGKTTLARMLIRHLARNPATEVPSPTFTLLQMYELPHFPLAAKLKATVAVKRSTVESPNVIALLPGSDPRLNEFFLLFTEGYRDCEMPSVERVARWPSRVLAKLRRGASVSERVVTWCGGDRSAGNREDP